MFEFKEGENFNHRNIYNISRIALKLSADASLRVTKVPKFKPDEEIGHKVLFRSLRLSAKVSQGKYEQQHYSYRR